MSMRSEFKSMNSWEWSAASIICGVMVFYIYENFPVASLGFAASSLFCGLMAFVRREK